MALWGRYAVVAVSVGYQRKTRFLWQAGGAARGSRWPQRSIHTRFGLAAVLVLGPAAFGCSAEGVRASRCTTGVDCPQGTGVQPGVSAADTLSTCNDPCECSKALAPQGTTVRGAALLFVVDQSDSMTWPFSGGGRDFNRWEALSASMTQAVSGLRGRDVHFGMLAFPAEGSGQGGGGFIISLPGLPPVGITFGSGFSLGCGVPESPQVPFTSTPDSMLGVLRATSPNGATPMGAALARARDYIEQTPLDGRRPVVVLVTDGEPNCGDTEDSVNNEILALRNAGVVTAVLGLEVPESVNLARLAASGGLAPANRFGYHRADSPGELTQALSSITSTAAQCDFEVNAELPTWQVVRLQLDGRNLPEDQWTSVQAPDGKHGVTLSPSLCEELSRTGDLSRLQVRLGDPQCTRLPQLI